MKVDEGFTIEQLPAVGTSALLTLWARAAESRSADPILIDPAAIALTEQLRPDLAAMATPRAQQLAADKLPPLLLRTLSLRARHFDQMACNFRQRFPRAIIVNLGAGLDTRFERLDDGEVRVIELDLPPMIALKRQLLPAHPRHELLASSVTDLEWMDALDRYDNRRFLFLAEGLLMYLPPHEVKDLVVTLAKRFPGSELVAEVFNAMWLRPPLGRLAAFKLQRQLHFDRSSLFQSGLDSPQEMEAWHPHIHFLGDWSFVDEHERKLGYFRWFRHIPWLRLIQYIVHYRFG